jgi:hypothetical protein
VGGSDTGPGERTEDRIADAVAAAAVKLWYRPGTAMRR